MVATLKCQASSMIKFGSSNKTPSSQATPLQQPLGFSRPQTSTFATSGALAYGSNLVASTMRKASTKLEEFDAEEVFGSLLGKQAKSEAGSPTFRSALEQVSYETSSLGQERPKRQGVARRVARIFGR